MKALTQSQPYRSIDCNLRYVALIQHALAELGFSISRIIPQYSYFLGYNFRLYFATPIPAITIEIILEASVTPPATLLKVHDN
jgi:hypothetical protein